MSSAILYVAIVVIWAAVLIPRWLRRDPAVPVSEAAPVEDAETPVTPETMEDEQPSSLPTARRVASGPPMARSRRPEPGPERMERAVRPERPVRPERSAEDLGADEQRDVAEWDEQAHRRVVSARRRLLLMLLGLAAGSAVLAVAKLAAWWVIVPPSVMLGGYLLMLREASKADAEQREMARIRRAERAARLRAQARAAAPVAQVIAIPAAPEVEEESIYDQYADAKLRAVGD